MKTGHQRTATPRRRGRNGGIRQKLAAGMNPNDVSFRGQRWGNRPAFLWIAERFGVLRFRLMVKRGPCMRPQASEGEAQHGLFCWTRRVGPGDERLHCG